MEYRSAMRSVSYVLVLFFSTVVSQISAQPPVVESVRNAASNLASALTPQMLVSIYGSNLASETASSGTPLPAELAGTSVTFNGIRAPLLYVSPGQVNTQVPSEIQGAVSANVVVTTAAGPSAPFAVSVSSGRTPGIFTQDSSGCGQGAVANIHADGTVTLNTPKASFDPQRDLGFTVFVTGLGSFPDRSDGAAWPFNAGDNQNTQFGVTLSTLGADYSAYSTDLSVSYAGPAPDTAGIDQVNALYFPEPNFTLPPPDRPNFTNPLPEGCRIALYLGSPGASDRYSQYVNVSILSGGGACADPPAESLGTVTWQQTVTSGPGGTSTAATVAMQFLKAPGIRFEQPPVVSVSSADSWGFFRPPPAVCAASYPATFDSSAIIVSGPGFGPISLQPANQNGIVSYQAALPTALQNGSYTVSAQGSDSVASFSAVATLPAPISITNDLRPGTTISLPFTLNWTGGHSDSVVTVQLLAHVPGQQSTPILFATASASAGSRPLPLPPPQAAFSFPTGTPIEIMVIQQPAKAPSRPFAASGLTLGGDQTWRYVFDFTGIESQ
jgi:uncharacterized protein (TIGR03437 family)